MCLAPCPSSAPAGLRGRPRRLKSGRTSMVFERHTFIVKLSPDRCLYRVLCRAHLFVNLVKSYNGNMIFLENMVFDVCSTYVRQIRKYKNQLQAIINFIGGVARRQSNFIWFFSWFYSLDNLSKLSDICRQAYFPKRSCCHPMV